MGIDEIIEEHKKKKIEFVEDNYNPTTKMGKDLKETMLEILRDKDA